MNQRRIDAMRDEDGHVDEETLFDMAGLSVDGEEPTLTVTEIAERLYKLADAPSNNQWDDLVQASEMDERQLLKSLLEEHRLFRCPDCKRFHEIATPKKQATTTEKET